MKQNRGVESIMNMKTYSIGNSIVLPHVRFINYGGRNSMMYHAEVLRANSHYKTLGCDSMDSSGFCLGHRISRDEFLKRYCGGVEPETNINEE
jgi:hypothetical protein